MMSDMFTTIQCESKLHLFIYNNDVLRCILFIISIIVNKDYILINFLFI